MKITPVYKVVVEFVDDERVEILRYLRACLALRDIHVDQDARKCAETFASYMETAVMSNQSVNGCNY